MIVMMQVFVSTLSFMAQVEVYVNRDGNVQKCEPSARHPASGVLTLKVGEKKCWCLRHTNIERPGRNSDSGSRGFGRIKLQIEH